MSSISPVVWRRFATSVRRGLAYVARGFGELVFPPVCAFCDVDLPEGGDVSLCIACRGLLDPPAVYRCPKCAAKVAETFRDGDCPWCRAHDLRFDRTWTVGSYRDHLRDAVLTLKHRGQELLGTTMAELLWRRLAADASRPAFDVVVPVPMHWWRRVRQGHNGPELTAEHLAKRLRVASAPRLLVRNRPTRPQAGLSPNERQENVRNAFAVRRGFQPSGLRVLLVDDVLTSGATCSEAARILKRAGVASVGTAIIGRAQGEV